jgi:hypothetical protein
MSSKEAMLSSKNIKFREYNYNSYDDIGIKFSEYRYNSYDDIVVF